MKFLFLYLVFAFPLQAATLNLSTLVASTPGIAGEKHIEVLATDTVIIDSSVDVGDLIINGKLLCREDAEIKAKTIIVNGTFECGTPTARFGGKFYISLKHSNKDPKDMKAEYRGLIVAQYGKLLLAGATHRSGHYRLSKNALVGEKSVTVSGDVSNWKDGETVVIASSSYNPEEFDVLKVSSVDGNVVTFHSTLQFRHWGTVEKFQTQSGEKILDQRAEIANLDRNIVIRADESTGAISELDIAGAELGGHVMVHKGGYANVDSVEFSRMGQAGVMARYPFHWHLAGDVPGQFIKNSSIHDSFQRCVTIHQTNQALVDNNVCFSFKGHGFFMEDGNEINNTISNNLGIRARNPNPSKILLSSDNSNGMVSGVTAKRFPAVSVFWITNPQNKVFNNIAAGSVGNGFWMSFVNIVKKFNRATGEFDGEELARPLVTNTLQYENNIAHSCRVGHTWDGAPIQRVYPAGEFNPYKLDPPNPNNPMDRKLEMAHYHPSVTPVFKGLVAYKNLHSGVYFRGDTAVFDNAIFADNGWSMFLAYSQIVKNTLFVGRSLNNGPQDDEYLRLKYPERQAGLILYDGPWELDTVDFKNFPTVKKEIITAGVTKEVTAVPMNTIGGFDKLTNIARKVAFSPEPYHRLYMEPLETATVGWLEEILSNSIRDLDGSITGTVNGLLLPASPFTRYSACNPISKNGFDSFRGFVLCPPETVTATISFSADGEAASRVPYLMYRNDGVASYPKADWDLLDIVGDPSKGRILQKKMLLLKNPAYRYEALLRPSAVADPDGLVNLNVKMLAEKPGIILPVTKVSGVGSGCKLESYNGVPAPASFSSLAALESATSNGYFSSGNDFYIRLKSETPFFPIKTSSYGSAQGSTSNSYRIICSAPVINKVMGYVDAVTKRSDGSVTVDGWVCDYGKEEVTQAHIYVGGAAGSGGKMIGSAIADRNSEAGINFLCGNATNKGHRYSFIVPATALAANPGASVYVHGISLSGKSNNAISNSGKFYLPGVSLVKKNCIENGVTILHGTSVTRYKDARVAYGQSCLSEVRTCNDGVFSGSYLQSSCYVSPPPVREGSGTL